MPDQFLPPLPSDAFAFAAEPPEFLDLASNTLGNVATAADGWDSVFDPVLDHHQVHGSLIEAIKRCFRPVDRPWADFQAPAEGFIDLDLASFLETGDGLVSDFLALPPLENFAPAVLPSPVPTGSAAGGAGATIPPGTPPAPAVIPGVPPGIIP